MQIRQPQECSLLFSIASGLKFYFESATGQTAIHSANLTWQYHRCILGNNR